MRGKMRRFISRFISTNAHKDRKKVESVNILNHSEIARAVRARFGTVYWMLIEDILKGEVLSDSRDQGSLQQVKI